ncbi:MAG TPA: hypothetical protein ENJ28_07600 [Gammaproteobacteria bacterium]|nr:hypothetical protein [Gammaproteobacteria bacterium]
MNNMLKYSLFVVVTTIISVVILMPIVTHENEYKVVIVNASEHPISSVVISGAGVESNKLGPIKPGYLQDFIMTPLEDGALKYHMVQSGQQLNGIINKDLKKGDVGDIYVVMGELQKVKIYDEYEGAY